jgi:hypothetical protein
MGGDGTTGAAQAVPPQPPRCFSFPYPPYPIQQQFMEALYQTLEEGQIGLFESPTGAWSLPRMACGRVLQPLSGQGADSI